MQTPLNGTFNPLQKAFDPTNNRDKYHDSFSRAEKLRTNPLSQQSLLNDINPRRSSDNSSITVWSPEKENIVPLG